MVIFSTKDTKSLSSALIPKISLEPCKTLFTTFLLPLSIGACEALGGNLLTDAFGVVALVALTPLIAIQIMGLIYRVKQHNAEKIAPQAQIVEDELNEIYEFEEE